MTLSMCILELITYVIIAFVGLGLRPRISFFSVISSIILFTGWYVYSLTTATPFPFLFILIFIMIIIMKEKLYISLCVITASSLAMNIISSFLSFVIYVFNPSQYTNTINIIYISSIITTLVLIIMSIIVRGRSKSIQLIIRELRLRQCIAIICLCIFDFFISAMTIILMEQEINQIGRYLIVATIYLTIITSIVLLVLYLRLHRLNALLNEANNTNTKLLRLEEKHFKTLQEKNMDLRAFKHDYNHHICALQGLITNAPDKLIPYIESLTSIQEQTHYINCNNLVADSVINYYYEEFKNNDVPFEVTGAFPEHIAIEDSDLCIILSNILSNAYDEILRIISDNTIKPAVYCSIFILDNYIEICVENTSHEYADTTITTTSKPDTINHGFGLNNIKNAAKKYNGNLHVSYCDNMFKTSVKLKYR